MLALNFLLKLVKSWKGLTSKLSMLTLVLHLTMAVIYGLYYFGVYGSHHSVVCASSTMTLSPFPYNNTTELEVFLEEPGSTNVNDEFESVIKYGFLAQTLVFFLTLHNIFSKSTD